MRLPKSIAHPTVSVMATKPCTTSSSKPTRQAVQQKYLYGYSRGTKHRDNRSREHFEVSLLPISFKAAEVIGRGSYGTVLQVTAMNRKSYALKIIRNDNVNFEEILIHKQLSHPNIIQYHSHWKEQWADVFTILAKFGRTHWKTLFQQLMKSLKLKMAHFGLIFIRMECCEQTVADAISKGLYEDETRLRLTFLGILDGVAYLHRRCIIHGDIKTENIGVNSQGQDPKLLDFGNSMQCSSDSCSGHQSDIYDTGIVFFEMLFGPLTSDDRQHLISDFICSDILPPVPNGPDSQYFRPVLKAMLDPSEDEQDLNENEGPTAEELRNFEYFQPTFGVRASAAPPTGPRKKLGPQFPEKTNLCEILSNCLAILGSLLTGSSLVGYLIFVCVLIILCVLVLMSNCSSTNISQNRSSIFSQNKWTCRKRAKFLSVSKHAISRLARY